jgi:hypothetical protein
MKTSTLITLASVVCTSLVLAADEDPATRQLQVYPKNLARQNVGSNLFLYNAANQTYAPTEAAAAWLDEDVTTGWPVLAGKQHYLVALSSPELVSNFSVSAKPSDGTVSIYAGDEPGVPGSKSWTPLAENVPFNSINGKRLDKPFAQFAKYILIETDLTNPGPLYSLYLWGQKPATVYELRPRDQAIDAHAIFGQYNDKTAFNANGLYTQSVMSYASSPDGSLAWQKAIDDNPETGVSINGTSNEPGAVIKYGSPEVISRVALLTGGNAKGKVDFFALGDSAPTTSLEGLTPTVSIVLDGTNDRSSIDFPPINAAKLAIRWTPASPNDTLDLREIESFAGTSLNDSEVALKPAAVAAYDPGARTNGDSKDGKDAKDPIAQGPDNKDPAEVADFRGGSPYLPGALGFPPDPNRRIVRFLSQ